MASPLKSSLALARFPASFQVLSASKSCLATKANKSFPFRYRGQKDPVGQGIPQQQV